LCRRFLSTREEFEFARRFDRNLCQTTLDNKAKRLRI
jgi:hypothetical protein